MLKYFSVDINEGFIPVITFNEGSSSCRRHSAVDESLCLSHTETRINNASTSGGAKTLITVNNSCLTAIVNG